MGKLIYPEESYAIIGACFDVYNDKGHGFLEGVYQECVEIELETAGIPYAVKPPITLSYRGRELKHTYEPDLVCYEKIIVELKAARALTDEHRCQLLNYLNATGLKLGLLVNFGSWPKLEYERIVLGDRSGVGENAGES